MSDQLVLSADTSRITGSRATRRLRREGRIPGVVYGLGEDPVAVSVVYGELRAAMSTDAGLNALLNLDVGGESQQCLVKDLQRHPVRDEVIHVDFIRIDPNMEVEVAVPLVLTGEAREVANASGMVDQAMFQLQVYAKPGAIPNELEADVTELTVGDSIRVADIVLPAGVRTEVDPEEAIAVAMVTRSTIEAMQREADEAESAEEGDAPAAAADDGGDGGDTDGD